MDSALGNWKNSDMVFEKIEENKNAIKAMETSMITILQIFEETKKKEELISNTLVTVNRDELLELEKKYDENLKVFMEEYSSVGR